MIGAELRIRDAGRWAEGCVSGWLLNRRHVVSIRAVLSAAMKSAPQTYQLYIELKRSITIEVGSLGKLRFPSGRYIYTGSGRRNLEARIRRHLNRRKQPHWHIDYLLAQPEAHVIRIIRSSIGECTLNQSTAGDVLFPRFGASDCRRGCSSHLKRQSKPRPRKVRNRRAQANLTSCIRMTAP